MYIGDSLVSVLFWGLGHMFPPGMQSPTKHNWKCWRVSSFLVKGCILVIHWFLSTSGDWGPFSHRIRNFPRTDDTTIRRANGPGRVGSRVCDVCDPAMLCDPSCGRYCIPFFIYGAALGGIRRGNTCLEPASNPRRSGATLGSDPKNASKKRP